MRPFELHWIVGLAFLAGVVLHPLPANSQDPLAPAGEPLPEATENSGVSATAKTPSPPNGATDKVKRHSRPTQRRSPARGCDRSASPKYRAMAARWVRPIRAGKPRYRDGFRELTVRSVNYGEQHRVFLFDADGELTNEALDDLSWLLRDKDTGEEHPIHPRLAMLLYRLAESFKVYSFNIISGYRASSDPDQESYHNKGRAVDLAMPGVPIGALARRVRSFGHVGVGLYPAAGYVHLDVREGPSFFWIDPSGPGKRSCFRRLQSDVGPRADRRWKPSDDRPTPKRDAQGQVLGATPEPPDSVGDEFEP